MVSGRASSRAERSTEPSGSPSEPSRAKRRAEPILERSESPSRANPLCRAKLLARTTLPPSGSGSAVQLASALFRWFRGSLRVAGGGTGERSRAPPAAEDSRLAVKAQGGER